MSRGGPYDPGDTRTPDMLLEDLFPDLDELGRPYDEVAWEPVTRLHQFPVVFGVTAVGTSASAVTWQPGGSPPSPPPEESPPAAQLLRLHPPA